MYKSSSSLLGLRRAKSTSSVSHTSHTSHPSTTLIDDPVIIISSAHQHALAAANHAFARAGGRENVRPDTAAADRANLMVGGGSGSGGGMEVIHEGLVGEQGLALRRSDSQRSVASGNGAVSLRRSHSFRRTMRRDEPGMLKTTLRDVELPRVLAARSAAGRAGTVNEAQKIRKARSMVSWTSASPTPSPVARGGKENRPPDIQRINKVLPSSVPNNVETPKTQADIEPSPSYSIEPDNRLWSGKLRHRTSFLMPSFKKKTGDVKTKQQNTNSDVASNHLFSPRAGSRNVSGSSSKKSESLKDKLKRYFRKSSGESTSTAGLPPQHIEATRIHFGNFVNVDDSQPEQNNNVQPLSGYNREHASSSPPAYEAFLSTNHGCMTQRSSTPVKSETTIESKSRVTSWADSTVPGSVVSQDNQLSIIAEDEGDITALPTIPSEKRSSSLGSSFLKKFIRNRGPSSSHNGNPTTEVPASANSENSQYGHVLPTAAKNSLHSPLPSKRRRSSLLSLTTSWRNKPTVRSVSPDPLPKQESPQEQQQRIDNSSSPPAPDPQITLVRKLRKKHLPSPPPLTLPPQSQPASPFSTPDQPTATSSSTTTITQPANRRWQATPPLESHQSLFFPRSPSSVSPSRRARALQACTSDVNGMSLTLTRTVDGPQQQQQEEEGEGREKGLVGAISPSVYSRASGECSPRLAELVAMGGLGDSKSAEPQKSLERDDSGQVREDIQEWRSFLASELADMSLTSIGSNGPFLDDKDYLTSTPMRESRNKGKGHVREMQQIVDESENMDTDRLQVPVATTIARASSSSPRKISRKHDSRNRTPSTLKTSPFMLHEDGRRLHHQEKENTVPRRGVSNGPEDPRLLSLASLMNDRFPMFDTGGPSSRPGSTSSLRAIMAAKSSSEKPFKNEKPTRGNPGRNSAIHQQKSSPLTKSEANLLKSTISEAQPAINSSRLQPTPTTMSAVKEPSPNPPKAHTINIPSATAMQQPTSSQIVLAPTSTITTTSHILSPIPRRRQSTLVATLTTASLTSSYHTARQDAPKAITSTTTATTASSSSLPAPSPQPSPSLSLSLPAVPTATTGPHTPRPVVARASSFESESSASESLLLLRLPGSGSVSRLGIRRSGALRAVHHGHHRAAAALADRSERGRGVGHCGGTTTTTTTMAAAAAAALVPVVRVEGLMIAADEASLKAEGRLGKESCKGELAAAAAANRVGTSAAAAGAGTSSPFGIQPWKSALKENSSPVREVGSADSSPGKRMAERWLNERKTTVGAYGAAGRREGGSSPMFL